MSPARRAVVVATALVAVLGLLAPVPAAAAPSPSAQSPAAPSSTGAQELGRSRGGLPITAEYLGPRDPAVTVVVLGSMHGLELAGEAVVRRLRARAAADLPADAGLWLVPTMNPDGRGRHRENARGVDLNRNFPGDWIAQGPRGGPKWSGPSAGSEPETQAMVAFLERVRPDAVISFHQPFGVVDLTHRRARNEARLLARDMGLPARVVSCSGPCRGTLTEFADRLGAVAITVELPPEPTRALERRSAAAVLALADRLGG